MNLSPVSANNAPFAHLFRRWRRAIVGATRESSDGRAGKPDHAAIPRLGGGAAAHPRAGRRRLAQLSAHLRLGGCGCRGFGADRKRRPPHAAPDTARQGDLGERPRRRRLIFALRNAPAAYSRQSSFATASTTRASIGSTALGNAAATWPSRPTRYLWKFHFGVSSGRSLAAHL